jgi:GNAT superfamily N-acetyltransferase
MTPLAWAEEPPAASEYLTLRAAVGLGARREEAARLGLAGGLFAVTVRDAGALVGMGRVVGDGGAFAQVVDIAVAASHRRRGIATEIVRRLVAWCDESLPPSCYVSLIADPGAERIYERAGFVRRLGMGRYVPEAGSGRLAGPDPLA